MQQNALKMLHEEEKAQLVDLLGKNNLQSMLILGGLVLIYFLGDSLGLPPQFRNYTFFLLILILYLTFNSYRTYKVLKDNDFPEKYIRMNLIISTVRFAGLVVFFFLMTP